VPIFGPEATVTGCLNLSSRIEAPADAPLALGLTRSTARAIEQRVFRMRFAECWIILCALPAGGHLPGLLAIDRDHRVVGAGWRARASLGLDGAMLRRGLGLWDLFDAAPGLLAKAVDADFRTTLTRQDGAEIWSVLITPPRAGSRIWARDACGGFEARPRWLSADCTAPTERDKRLSSGLSPRILRRVLDHIESRIGEALPLAELAVLAGVCPSHFSEVFRRSTGMPPHRWILVRRVERAKKLLEDDTLTVTDIAFAIGFSSSSHFASAFRHLTGLSPSAFRRGRNGSS